MSVSVREGEREMCLCVNERMRECERGGWSLRETARRSWHGRGKRTEARAKSGCGSRGKGRNVMFVLGAGQEEVLLLCTNIKLEPHTIRTALQTKQRGTALPCLWFRTSALGPELSPIFPPSSSHLRGVSSSA